MHTDAHPRSLRGLGSLVASLAIGLAPAALATLAALASLTPVAARAETPDIARQHREYQSAREVWEQPQVPAGLAGPEQNRTAGTTLRGSDAGRTAMLLRNVRFTVVDGIGYWVKELAATLEPVKAGDPVDFDRVESFRIRLQRGHVVVRSRALTALFNHHVLDYPGHQLSNVRVATGKNRMTAQGDVTLPALALTVPSEFTGTIKLNKNSTLTYDIDGLSAFGIPIEDVLKCLNIPLTRLMTLNRPGVTLRDFSMLLDPHSAFPPPKLVGSISKAWLGRDGLHLTFGDGADARFDTPSDLGESYIWMQSGDPKFFGQIVTNADIAVVPARRGDTLSFNLYGYRQQLSKGVGHIDADGRVTIELPQ